MEYSGSCHCGAITFSFSHDEIDSGMQCNCSICKRKGAALSSFVLSREELHLEYLPETHGAYQFGSKIAEHYFCNCCGIFTHVKTRLNPGCYRVNLGCIDKIDPSDLTIEVYDGKDL